MRRYLLLAALLALPVRAQDSAPETPAESTALTPEELAARQARVGEQLEKLEETMRRIADILKTTNPEQAARLRLAWQRSKDDRNLDVIEEIENLLRENHYTLAVERQKDLEGALLRLLDILLDRDAERKDLQEKIERLEQMGQTLTRLIEEERNHFHETEKFASPEKTLQRAAAAKARLADLIDRQEKLIERTGRSETEAAERVAALRQRLDDLVRRQAGLRGKSDPGDQQRIRDEANKLAEDLAAHAQALPDAMKQDKLGRTNPADQAADAVRRAAQAMEKAAGNMRSGGDFAPRQAEAEQELREASDALQRLAERHRRHAQQELAEDQERIRKDTERLQSDLERLERSAPGSDSGAGSVGKATEPMEKAEKGLSKGQRNEALPHEQEARRRLEEARKQLEEFEKELKRLIELPDYDKLREKQEGTTEKTQELLDRMKRESGSQPGSDGQPTPGQQGVEGARKAMQRAERNLRNRSAKGANSDQREAIERLEKAREELEEALRQLREEEQLMLLEALERRLTRMLQKQTAIFKQTLALNVRLRDAGPTPPRALADQGRQLGEGESELAMEAEKLLRILREEGTSIVIPEVVEDMRKDLDGLAARLRRLDAGAYTQQVQQDVMQTLRELIEVIQEELDRRQGRQSGQQGEEQEGENEENLLPTSAELKMLRSLQVRVNERTLQFDRLIEKDEVEQGRLAEKQENVGTLTRTMADRLNREDDGG